MNNDMETIILTDENNNDVEFEVVEKVLVKDKKYLIVTPLEGNDDEALALYIMEKDGECYFKPVEDSKELKLVEEAYEELLLQE